MLATLGAGHDQFPQPDLRCPATLLLPAGRANAERQLVPSPTTRVVYANVSLRTREGKTALGRSAIADSERERLDRRKSQNDPN